VIRLSYIAVRGQSAAGPFAGLLELAGGLQVISADNAFGKSLAAKSVAWCLGVEPIFGIFSNDATCFPQAVLERLQLTDGRYSDVLSSECEIEIAHNDGRKLRLCRSIKGDASYVRVQEHGTDQSVRESRLLARRGTMQDETGGLQHLLFEWLKWPRVEVSTFKGNPSEVYLENLVPSFYIDQTEGWTEIQAQQIGRYSQLEIKEIAVEYLLGATDAIGARVAQRQNVQRQGALREAARNIAERVASLVQRRDWHVDWPGGGSVEVILKRWTRQTLRQALKSDANVDLAETMIALSQRAERLRKSLATDGVDRHNTSAPAEASQKAIGLKQRRHGLNESLNTLRIQKEQTDELIASLDHRIQSASDLLRLKTTGVGRLDHVECPTCHRDLDPKTFALTGQSAESVSTHIESLKRDREMMVTNARSIDAGLRTARASMLSLDTELREAERALMSVTAAVGAEREQVAKIVGDLASVERETDRARETLAEIDEIQVEIDRWISEAQTLTVQEVGSVDLRERKLAFLDALRKYLVELQHSEIAEGTAALLTFDEQYVPYFDNRRLRSLGSASDHSRLTAAYALALAAMGTKPTGLHPGVVILDEPLQQNPDPGHRSRFVQFLSRELARTAAFQTIIFTSLTTEEVARLREQGVNVQTPAGKKWLKLVPPSEPPKEVGAPKESASKTV
jgi:hypothetical protein